MDLKIVAQTKIVRSIIISRSRMSEAHIRGLGIKSKWCLMGILVAKREFYMTWRQAGACFGVRPQTAASSALRYEAEVFDSPRLFEIFTDLGCLAQEYWGQISQSLPAQSANVAARPDRQE